jgi:hypothetical protein
MTNISCKSRLSKRQPPTATILCASLAIAAAALMTGAAVAQSPAAATPAPGQPMSVPDGYAIHQSVDLGGRMANVNGSNAMYSTLVNLQSGPRVQGETFELHGLAGKDHPILDDLKAFSTGLGGDPYSYSKLDFNKGKLYEFSGTFRRDRQYFDYDLLGNPGIPGGNSIPIGPSTAPTGSYAWSQIQQSPFLFNTVRRMTDTNLTILPLSTFTFRAGYSQNTFEGPSMTPSGYQIGGSYAVLLEQYQRNSSDDFTAGIDWKPVQGTKLTFEEEVDHYKGDSYFTLAPQDYTAQESDGTKVALLANYYAFLPYGYNAAGNFVPYAASSVKGAGAASGACNASIANAATILRANPAGGLPIIDPACNVISSYTRSQPTRELFPTEIFRLQSSSVKNISINGNLRYTNAKMNLPNYSEVFQGLQGANRELAGSASASAKREVMAADFGIVWQATEKVSVADAVSFSNVHQPGTAVETGGTTVTVPTTVGQETINNTNLTATVVTTGNAPSMPTEGGPGIGTPLAGYFGQRFVTNNATLTWDATPRSTFSVTYRYQDHLISEGQGTAAHNVTIPANNTTSGEVEIQENGGIFNAALRPSANWEINGSVEAMFNDNVFTPMGFRQSWHYRVRTLFRPKPWATVSGAFNDLERHNNTNNNQSFPGNTTAYYGPLDHVDHSRVVSFGAQLFPNDRYGLDLNYSYSDVYLSVNACFQGAASILPGGAVAPGAATQSAVLCGPASGTHGLAVLYLGRDFEDQPTQFGSASLMYSPAKQIRSNLGYRVNAVNGSRSFTDASDVNGTLVSTYQTPFVNVAWTVHKNLTWKGEYNYSGYGEGGGQSGARYCNANAALVSGATSAPTVLCSSVANTAMSAGSPAYGFTAPRNFHANNVTLGLHYEF